MVSLDVQFIFKIESDLKSSLVFLNLVLSFAIFCFALSLNIYIYIYLFLLLPNLLWNL